MQGQSLTGEATKWQISPGTGGWGGLNFHWVKGKNPVGKVSLLLLQRGVKLLLFFEVEVTTCRMFTEL